MAIIQWPKDLPVPKTITCVLCGQAKSPLAVSAGLQDATGKQAFACEEHKRERRYIVGWADYEVTQRQSRIQYAVMAEAAHG
ncbi:MAG TPA: hypothetical protein VJ843_04790 [Candidatus Saccharimonadales bacterium]|nr:hypothetical protein [Candidatus Saccharimonadales bacterium]